MGNVCRSPTAAGVFRKLAEKEGILDRLEIDSAATHLYHVGKAPDPRAQQAALERGIDIGMVRARQVDERDFERFDRILVMDRHDYEALVALCPADYVRKIRFLLDFAPHLRIRDVPDPFYGGSFGFERMLDMVEDAAFGLLRDLCDEAFSPRSD